MIRKFFRWLNTKTGKEHLGPIMPEDLSRHPDDQTISPFTAARQMVDAQDKRKNEQQNVGRGGVLKVTDAHTITDNAFNIPVFDYFGWMPTTLRAWLPKWCQPITREAVAFVCQGRHRC